MSVLERLTPLHCIGESHCLRLRDLVYRGSEGTEALHARVTFLPDFAAADAIGKDGLHPQLAAALVASGLCVAQPVEGGGEELEPAHGPASFDRRVRAAREAALSGRPLVAPAMMLFAGDKDLISMARTLHDRGDFELPDDPGYGRDESRARINFGAVERFAQRSLSPLFEVLELLRDAGFTRTLVHGLMPRTRDTARSAKWYGGVEVDPALCSKLAIAMNRAIEARCRALGLGFVDVWERMCRGGYLDPEFELDGIHANESANLISMELASRELAKRTRRAVNPAQYQLLTELSPAIAAGGKAVDAPAISRASVVRLPAPADPSQYRNALSSGDARAALDLGARYETGVILASDIGPYTTGGAAAASHAVPGPISTRRALWVVEGAVTARVRFAADGDPRPTMIAAGQALVWDADEGRVELAAAHPGCRVVDLRLLPRLPGEPHRVVWTSDSGWPTDPFYIERGGEAPIRRWREIEGKTVAAVRPPARADRDAGADASLVGPRDESVAGPRPTAAREEIRARAPCEHARQ